MKIFIKIIITITLSMLVVLASCTTTGKNSPPAGKEGWIDSHTYVIISLGSPDAKQQNIDERKKQSRYVAESNARKDVMGRFTYNPAYEEVQFDNKVVSVRIKVLGNMVQAGTVIHEEFDPEQNCQITYRVYSKNLRGQVENLYTGWENNDRESASLKNADNTKISGKSSNPDAATNPDKYLVENQGAFFGDDRYVFKVTGNANKNEKDIEKRKTRSRQAAILLTQYGIIKNLYNLKKELYGDPESEYDNRLKVFNNELSEIVKSGSVISEKFDAEHNCTILYQIKRKGFRKWAEQPL